MHFKEQLMGDRITLGFIGAGNMAEALIKGVLNAKFATAQQIRVFDPVEERRVYIFDGYGISALASNRELAQQAEILVLAVKPQQLDSVLEEIKGHLKAETLLISIVAGVKLKRISDALGGHSRLVRVMPNTPALVGAGAAGLYFPPQLERPDRDKALEIFRGVGLAEEIEKEELMDAVTGLSGSGPAYGFMMIEAMADGGVLGGLPRNVAQKLAAQTLLGAAMMVLTSGIHPGKLKDMVASPGGTTIEGIKVLEEKGLRRALLTAVEAATRRSRELG
jgi:pyrroline-5-carboxylate reductase